MKRTFHFLIFLLIIIILLSVFITCGCNAPATSANETQAETAVAVTTPVTAAATTAPTAGTWTYSDDDTAVTTAPQADFSCIFGYWEVEPESLKNSANDVLGMNSTYLNITNVTASSILYTFYAMAPNEPSPTGYQMETWGTNVHIISVKESQTFDIWLDFLYTADISSDRQGEIYCLPYPEQTGITVKKVSVNGTVINENIDLSGLYDTNTGRALAFKCLGAGRLSLQDIDSGGRPFYLSATGPVTHITIN